MPNQKKPSLLVSEGEGNEVPALGGKIFELEEYQSPFERLIAHSTSEERGDSLNVSASTTWSRRKEKTEDARANGSTRKLYQTGNKSSWFLLSSHAPRTKSSAVTLLACTFCILQIGFFWASLLSKSWLETRLDLSLLLPTTQIEKDMSEVLHSITLTSLFGDLLGANQQWAALALVLTSLVLPCLCVVCAVTWTVEDRRRQNCILSNDMRNSKGGRKGQWSWLCPRIFIECSARIGFCLFFIVLIVDLGISPFEVKFMEARVAVVNEIKGGMASYTLGILFGILVFVLLRIGRTNDRTIIGHSYTSENDVLRKDFVGEGREKRCLKFSFRADSVEITNKDGNECELGGITEELVTPLEQKPCSGENLLRCGNAIVMETDHPRRNLDKDLVRSIQIESVPLWKRIILYELALMSMVLWLPTMFLPLFHLKYDGVMSEYVPEISFSIGLKDFPTEIWEHGISAGTNRFILSVLEIIFIFLVVVGPFTATLSAIGTWIFGEQSSAFCRRLVWLLQPLLGLAVFGAALQVSISSFGKVIESAINNLHVGIRTELQAVDTEISFAIVVEPLMGFWILLVESVAVELFVVLTLTWHNRFH